LKSATPGHWPWALKGPGLPALKEPVIIYPRFLFEYSKKAPSCQLVTDRCIGYRKVIPLVINFKTAKPKAYISKPTYEDLKTAKYPLSPINSQ
jgi:hypothetical protein